MPISRWDPSFSSTAPDAKFKTFFEGTTKYYIRIQRDVIAGQRTNPKVTIGISRGTHVEDNEIAEGDDSYFEGDQCHGTASDPGRHDGETTRATVSVTWQSTPFG